MKKLFIMGVLLLMSLYGAKAQGVKFGLGVNGQLPTTPSGLRDSYSSGIGFSGVVKYFINSNISIGGQVGYSYFFGRKQEQPTNGNITSTTPTMSIIPISANFDYYIDLGGEDTQFYVGVDAGLAVMRSGAKVEHLGTSTTTNENKSYFIGVPHAGVKFSNFYAEVQYRSIFTDVDNTGMVGLQLSYLFGLE